MSLRALVAVDLIRTTGHRRILDGVSLTAAPGDRIGLIGENGVGKTTLLRLLAGVDQPDHGTVERPSDLGFLAQELAYQHATTVQRVVDDSLRDARETLRALAELTQRLTDTPDDASVLERYGQVLDRAQDHDAWDADRRADLVLDGLGLGDLPRHRTLAEISGGQRGRLALAALLVRRPSALLLDEPTNHLDDAAASFLASQLRELRGVVVLASHDRAFLDDVCTDLLDLDPAMTGPARFGGNYSAYQATRRAERERWHRQFADEQAELQQLRHAASVTARSVAHGRPARDSEKMGYGHTAGRVQQQVSRRVRDATRRLEELERAQVRKPPTALEFRAKRLTVAQAPGTVMSLREVRVPGRLALTQLDVAGDDHVLITGPNGAGKSTLLAAMAGLVPVEGQLSRRRGVKVGYLPQDSVFDRPQLTAGEAYEAAVGPELAERVPLRSFGLVAARDAATATGDMSVGQRRRLHLAIVLADPPDLLLLDEPTNHLSPLLADELQDAIDAASGAIVVASHDRWLRRRWKGRQLDLRAATSTDAVDAG